jgi:hypothetical protein
MRDVMASVCGGMATQSAQVEAEFDQYTTIAHYYALKLAAGEVQFSKVHMYMHVS